MFNKDLLLCLIKIYYIYCMVRKVGIYKIINPVGKVYIGQSLDIDKRIDYYKKMRCKDQPLLYNSLL